MSYCYDQDGKLVCDHCGRSGGVRKRKCPYTVNVAATRSVRYHIPYCYPAALCSACYDAFKHKLHETCAEQAAKRQAEEDEIQSHLDAGELFVLSATRHEQPAGTVLVTFGAFGRDDVVLSMPADDYDPANKPRLSQYK